MAFDKESILNTASGENYLFGRRVLTTSFVEEELTPENIITILTNILPKHNINMKEIDYLVGVYRGNQDILKKTKLVRTDINNKVVENTAYHIVEFKKGYVFGDQIQYVQRGSVEKEEIETLNQYMVANDKATKDKDLGEDWYIGGNAYRMAFSNDDIDKPFVIYNADPSLTGVVYSTSYDQRPMLAFYMALKYNYNTKENYYQVTVYTKKNVYTFNTTESPFKNKTSLGVMYIPSKIDKEETNWLGQIPIVEYPLNKSRLGLIELVKSSLDTLNKISSNDIDGIEQFVQSLIAMFNVNIDVDGFRKMVQAGAVIVNSNSDRGKSADMKMLGTQLQHSETKILWDRLYNTMLTIAGVPRMTDKASSGDTGQARSIGEGWTMADERAKQDELSYKSSDKRILDIVLYILKNKNLIKDLKTSDIDIKFTRNKSDNMMTKAQTLLMLKQAQIDPSVAIEVSQLFSDSNDVVKKSETFYGEEFWKLVDNVAKGNTNNDSKNSDLSKNVESTVKV